VTVAAKIVLTIVFYIANAIATREKAPKSPTSATS
jgi:hypothetical protein